MKSNRPLTKLTTRNRRNLAQWLARSSEMSLSEA